MFVHWLKPVRRCPRCGLVIERGEGAMLGSMSINLGVTMALLLGVIVVWFVVDLPDVQTTPLVVTCAAIAIFVPLAFFPFAKTIWAAIDVRMHSGDSSYADPDEAKRLRHDV